MFGHGHKKQFVEGGTCRIPLRYTHSVMKQGQIVVASQGPKKRDRPVLERHSSLTNIPFPEKKKKKKNRKLKGVLFFFVVSASSRPRFFYRRAILWSPGFLLVFPFFFSSRFSVALFASPPLLDPCPQCPFRCVPDFLYFSFPFLFFFPFFFLHRKANLECRTLLLSNTTV